MIATILKTVMITIIGISYIRSFGVFRLKCNKLSRKAAVRVVKVIA